MDKRVPSKEKLEKYSIIMIGVLAIFFILIFVKKSKKSINNSFLEL